MDCAAGNVGVPGAVVEGDSLALVVVDRAAFDGKKSRAIGADSHFPVAGDGAIAKPDAARSGILGGKGDGMAGGMIELGVEVESVESGR